MLESVFQSKLILELKARFPGCEILKNDASLRPGIPDLLILYGPHWAMLECKRNATASHRPNQDFYIERFSKTSFAAFIYPENKEEVLNAMEQSFQP